jgi:uncharacterized protein
MIDPLPTEPVPPSPPAAEPPRPAAAIAPPAPLPGEARDAVVDALRGAALLGVLAVNLLSMGFPTATGVGATADSTVGGWALSVTNLAFTGKAYALLALLFGYGVGAQALRVAAGGGEPSRLLKRRFLALGAIGMVHGLLGWYGDILVTYAAFGFCLLPFMKAKQRTLLRTAGGLLLGVAALYLALGGLIHLVTGLARRAPELAKLTESIRAASESDAVEALRAYGQGPYGALFRRRLFDFVSGWGSAVAMLPQALALFLVGLWSARAGLVTDPAWRPRLARLAAGLALIGLPVNVIYARLAGAGLAGGPAKMVLAAGAYTIAAPALAGAVAVMAILLREAAPVRGLVRVLAPLGRLSLSAYLLQTVVFTNVFYFHGLGLYGKLSFPTLLGLAIAFWLIELLLAGPWLARLRFGPAEWLVRSLTYGRRQPM